ncbi:MAG: YqeG family HAD IIIA-type phosphatase [Lachnospiraceae bacterium]|nr:YqeG family HAD IIIA-type phosphatase [Lachnospiraceae bacterium]
MFERFYPTIYTDSAYGIDYEGLSAKGYRGIIFDIDNTLVEHGAHADRRAIELFQRLHGLGFRVMILSNNKEPRVRSFQEEVTWCDYIYKAGKPAKKGYFASMELMGTKQSNTVTIGDQLFTDIWGANRSGIPSILVKPIDKKEEIQIVFKRRLEAIVLYFYKRSLKNDQLKEGGLLK